MTLRAVMCAGMCAALLIPPAATCAQSRVLIAPSAGVGFVIDDNLFSAPQGTTTSDMVMRVTPGLSASRETARTYWFGGYSFEAERYQDHATLTTPLARQSGSMFGRMSSSPATTFSLEAGYESSVLPNELNVTTGLATGRLRAWRWHGGPEIQHATSPRSSITLRYGLTTEGMAGREIVTHVVEASLAHEGGARTEMRLDPFFRQFTFDSRGLVTAGALAGLTRRVTPFTRLLLRAGPRLTEGERRLRPEVELTLRRRSEYTELSVNYTRTATTAIGLQGIVETQRVVASASHHRPALFDVSVSGGAYLNENAGTTARVYRVAGEVTRKLGPGLAIVAAYALDLQRGLLVTTHVAGNPAAIIADRGELLPAPLFTIDRSAVNVPLRRNVFAIKLLVAPLIRPTKLPPRDKDDGSDR